jgi:hypothetical protein
MSGPCEQCDHDPETVRASLRQDTATCDDCGKTYCVDCLVEMAIEQGLIQSSDQHAFVDSNDASALLWHCDKSDMDLCPECFEDKEG